MKKEKRWRKFYECDCYTEGIMLGYEFYDDVKEEYPLIDMAFFGHGFCGRHPLGFKEKIRWCWHLLKTGYPFIDGVMFSQQTAKELGEDLLKFANTDHTKKEVK